MKSHVSLPICLCDYRLLYRGVLSKPPHPPPAFTFISDGAALLDLLLSGRGIVSPSAGQSGTCKSGKLCPALSFEGFTHLLIASTLRSCRTLEHSGPESLDIRSRDLGPYRFLGETSSSQQGPTFSEQESTKIANCVGGDTETNDERANNVLQVNGNGRGTDNGHCIIYTSTMCAALHANVLAYFVRYSRVALR
ncbi:hypothetical protein J6590_093916 [Homalodisca vitripennis]|nr:hypothetical protein J6590_093916 [Homalodisca vitripennis]